MDTFIPSTITRLEKSYMNVFKLGASNGNPESYMNPALKEKFKNHFAKLCELEQSKNEEIDLIGNFKCTALENFDREFNNAFIELKKKTGNLEENARYKRFASEIDKVIVLDIKAETQDLGTMIDDDMELKETQLYIDPISKTQICDPVKNTICGHVYERNIIQEAIQMNGKIRCAYMGCNNTQYVKLSHLVDDYHLKAKLDLLTHQKEEEEDGKED